MTNLIKNKILMLALFSFIIVMGSELLAAKSKGKYNVDKNKVAISGYDMVAYFTLNKAVKGKSSIATEIAGVKYYFSTEKHKALFEKSPAKYQPQYGGWCAYAIGEKSDKVPVNPKTFKIKDGKLYLFYNQNFINTLKMWNKKEQEYLQAADKNWLTITDK